MPQIGPYDLKNNLFLAPMVGVSDTPFREICSQQGAGLTIGEMLTCNTELWRNERNRFKRVKPRIGGPQVVQIAGSDPAMMAEAARLNVDLGADAIDINMGCPAKKVLKKAAGSALLRDTKLVQAILRAVVGSLDAPVTLKIRTGWCPATRNGVEVARIAEGEGVRLLTVHGRTRADRFRGQAEYDTIARIKDAVSIPVIANGDIDSPAKAKQVLDHTGADGLMIGRAAQGRPWIFREIERYLAACGSGHGADLSLHPSPHFSAGLSADWSADFSAGLPVKSAVIQMHLKKLHEFYGKVKGVWYARKHVTAYVRDFPAAREFLLKFNAVDSDTEQLQLIQIYFEELISQDEGAIAA